MRLRTIALALIGAAMLGAGGFCAWLWSLPAAAEPWTATAVDQAETDELTRGLRPRRPGRPVVAVIGLNDATETTDYLMPGGILRRADVADVELLATEARPVKLYPALKVMPDSTTYSFDRRHPNGADYVIVPAMSRDDDPAVLGWIRAQARKGARIVAVCAGAKVAAAAGLLDSAAASDDPLVLSSRPAQ